MNAWSFFIGSSKSLFLMFDKDLHCWTMWLVIYLRHITFFKYFTFVSHMADLLPCSPKDMWTALTLLWLQSWTFTCGPIDWWSVLAWLFHWSLAALGTTQFHLLFWYRTSLAICDYIYTVLKWSIFAQATFVHTLPSPVLFSLVVYSAYLPLEILHSEQYYVPGSFTVHSAYLSL